MENLYHEIVDGIYWLGDETKYNELNTNAYLLIDQGQGVLIDPGSVLTFDRTLESIQALIPLENIDYVILQHQDPDLCSSTPLFEQLGLKFKIVTHWRSSVMIKYYGVNSKFYHIDENNYELTLRSGRKLNFIHTPYLHFPGSITTYDSKNRLLFSSDLFGAFDNNWSLYADDSYMERMKSFHEHYMPSNSILKPVMQIFSEMKIDIIASQHGSIIKENVSDYINELKNLQCGSYSTYIVEELYEVGGYSELLNEVNRRYEVHFSKKELFEVFKGSSIKIGNDLKIIEFNSLGIKLWDEYFEQIYDKKGIRWLTLIKTLVEKFIGKYQIDYPSVFLKTIIQSNIHMRKLFDENEYNRNEEDRINRRVNIIESRILKDSVTDFYGQKFASLFIEEEVKHFYYEDSKGGGIILFIDIDNMTSINYSYGMKLANTLISKVSKKLLASVNSKRTLFSRNGPGYIYYESLVGIDEAKEFSEKLLSMDWNIDEIPEDITLSIGIVDPNDFDNIGFDNYEKFADKIIETGLNRVARCKNNGGNCLSYQSEDGNLEDYIGKVLIVDDDELTIEVIKSLLSKKSIKVIVARDGDEAIKMIVTERPDIIICENDIKKRRGLSIKSDLKIDKDLDKIPFILLSNDRNDDLIIEVMDLGITNVLVKPILLVELSGIVDRVLKEVRENGI
ncbi:MAG: response regulator [Acidaminobacteraceae bacterium]